MHVRRLINAPHASAPAPADTADAVLDKYVGGVPSAQNAIDLLPGWHSALPASVDVTAGYSAFYNDIRILWAIEQFGSLAGRRVLELGPLEAGHTWMLEQQGPASIDAIEAHKMAYLRCLIVKEVLGMKLARFHLGDFVEYLKTTTERFDLIVASGVLYHMRDPIDVIRTMGQRSDALYLWTHYLSDEDMPPGDIRRGALIGEPEVREAEGVSVRLQERSYMGGWQNNKFCGGIRDRHRWMELDSLMALLRALGFADIRTAHRDPAHQNGPAISIFARRPDAAG